MIPDWLFPFLNMQQMLSAGPAQPFPISRFRHPVPISRLPGPGACGRACRRPPSDLRSMTWRSGGATRRPAWKKPGAGLPKELESLSYDHYRDIRYQARQCLWREAKLPFELTLFPSAALLRPAGEDQRSLRAGRDGNQVRSRPSSITAQQDRWRENGRRPRLCRLPRAFPDERQVQGRSAVLPRRQLFSRARQGPVLRLVRARPWPSTPACLPARSSRASSSSGSSGPPPAPQGNW